jgi:hypothetical protein
VLYIPPLHVTGGYIPPRAPAMYPYIHRLTEEHIDFFLFYIISVLTASTDVEPPKHDTYTTT